VKNLYNFRLGGSRWSLSLGEYLCLLLAVFCGWFAGSVKAWETEPARPVFVDQVILAPDAGVVDLAGHSAPAPH
jgi:hypothetical protein